MSSLKDEVLERTRIRNELLDQIVERAMTREGQTVQEIVSDIHYICNQLLNTCSGEKASYIPLTFNDKQVLIGMANQVAKVQELSGLERSTAIFLCNSLSKEEKEKIDIEKDYPSLHDIIR